MKLRSTLTLIAVTALLVVPRAYAEPDASSDAPNGFVQSLESSAGLIIKVPINEKGEELVSKAESRLHTGAPVKSNSDFRSAFEKGTSIDHSATVTEQDIARDSATNGWYYNPSSYRYYGYYNRPGYWSSNYYSNYYYPNYYYGRRYYSYTQPYWRTYYNRYSYNPYYGYRYYYYGRYW